VFEIRIVMPYYIKSITNLV